MKLAHPDLAEPLTWEGGGLQAMVVENRAYFSSLTQSLLGQAAGEKGPFVLSDVGTILDISRAADILLSPFSMSTEQTKMQGGIIKELTDIAIHDHPNKMCDLFSGINAFAQTLIFDSGEAYRYTQLSDPIPLLKAMRIMPDDTDLPLAERLLLYFRMNEKFCQKKLFVLFHLSMFLQEEEMLSFQKSVEYEKYSVLLLEGTDRLPIAVKKRIIDGDLCEL